MFHWVLNTTQVSKLLRAFDAIFSKTKFATEFPLEIFSRYLQLVCSLKSIFLICCKPWDMRILSYLFAVRDILVIIFSTRSINIFVCYCQWNYRFRSSVFYKSSTSLFISNTLFQIRLSAAAPFCPSSQICSLTFIVLKPPSLVVNIALNYRDKWHLRLFFENS